MSQSKTPLKVLRVARKRLAKGWTKGTWSSFDPRAKQAGMQHIFLCIEGAITSGRMLDQHCSPAQQKAGRYVNDAICLLVLNQTEKWRNLSVVLKMNLDESGSVDCIPGFNDNSDTTLDDVLEVMDLAIWQAECDELAAGQNVVNKTTVEAFEIEIPLGLPSVPDRIVVTQEFLDQLKV